MTSKRIRRSPETARATLLEAAERALDDAEHDGLTVAAVTAHANMTRSAFYHYFSGVDELVLTLLEGYEQEIREAVNPWLEGNQDMEDYRAATTQYLSDMYVVMQSHRNTLRAVLRAASTSRGVWDQWQTRAIDYFVELTREFIEQQVALGRSQVKDPERVARALILMNNGVWVDNTRRENPDDAMSIGRTVGGIWNTVIYGPA